MDQEIDWVHSQSGLCKVDHYSPEEQKDQDRKVICFVDVASLDVKDRGRSKRSAVDPSLDLRNLEEKEVIVIKDNEQDHHTNTEGAVCLFKQGSSEEVNVVSWLNNDLQKYAVGFQHALTPSGPHRSAYNSPAIDKMAQSSETSFRGSCSQRGDDLSYYVNKLCSLVVQMAQKEMKDKLESSGRCIRQSINTRGSKDRTGDDYGKMSPKSSHDDPRKASLFYGEMSDQCNQTGYRQGADRQMMERKQSGQDDSSVSKGLMVYANQVASDMMFSFMKTMKVQKGKHPPPACVVLKKVLLKHTREVISDLIDSTMKNLHNVTGVLMTDSDFVNTVKKNLFNAGTQKSTEILEAMVKRLFKALSGDDKKSQCLSFAALKTGAHCDSRSQGMQFATLKSEMHGPMGGRGYGQMKPLPSGSKGSDRHCSMDVYAKDLIVTALMLIQQHLLEKNKEQGYHESKTTSFGYVHDKSGGSKHSRSGGGKHDNIESQKCDLSSILLSIIQKVLREAGCPDESSDKGYKQPVFQECRPQRALPKSSGCPDMYNNMEQFNRQFIDQLVESVMKLCMLMAKGNDSDGRCGGRPLMGAGSEVIVNNQNCNNSTQNKELQAVLQWLVASQFNVPNLTFMNEHDGELARLPQLADKAARKGYSVGDIVQEVMKYYELQQMDAMSGRMPQCGLVEWLLANL